MVAIVNVGTNTSTSGATIAITVGAAGVPAGVTLFVCVTEKSTSGTNGTLADTATNSYSTVTSGSLANTAADGRGILFAVNNCKALVNTNTITYTKNLSGANAAISAFYMTGITPNATFTEGLVTATGTTGTITVTSGTLTRGDVALGVVFDSGSTTAGGNATFTQSGGGFATPPVEASTGASGSARVNGGTVVGTAAGTVTYNPSYSSTAQQWFLVVLGVIPAVLWGFGQNEGMHQTEGGFRSGRARARSAAAVMRGDDGNEYPITWCAFQFANQAFQITYDVPHDAFQGCIPFVPVFDETVSQEPRQRWEFRGAFLRGDDGSEGVFQNWKNAGWEVAPHQPQHPIYKGHHLKGIDGTDAPYVNWANLGIDEVFSQEPRAKWERRGAHLKGIDGTDAIFVNWKNAGWEVAPYQPQHLIYKGHGLKGIDGTDAPYVNWAYLGFEEVLSQDQRRPVVPRGGFLRGIDGIDSPPVTASTPAWPVDVQQQLTLPMWKRYQMFPREWRDSVEETLFVNWQYLGFEEINSQEPRAKWERRGSHLKGIDGTDAPYVFWKNLGTEEVFSQEPRQRWELRGSHLKGIDGIDGTYQFWRNAGWEVAPHQPQHPVYRGHGLRGIDGIEGPFVNWQYLGFEEIISQDPRQRWERRGAYMRGDDGIEPIYVNWANLGFDEILSQDLRPRVERRGAHLKGIDGTDAIFVNWKNAGWEVQPYQPQHVWFRGHGLKGIDGTDAPYVNWQNAGWEVQPYQPQHLRFNNLDDGDKGIQYPFQFWKNAGWEIQAYQPQHLRFKNLDDGDRGIEAAFQATIVPFQWSTTTYPEYLKALRQAPAAALMRGDDGNEGTFNFWINAGWEVQPYQPQHLRFNNLDDGDRGIQSPFVQWYNQGWVPILHQPNHPVYRGHGLRGDDGTQGTYQFWINDGWEAVLHYLPHLRFHGEILRGIDGIESPFVNWQNLGFEEVNSQDPRRRWERSSAVLRGDDGTEGTFTFSVIPWFETTPHQPQHLYRYGGLLKSNFDIEAVYQFWRNAGWDPLLHSLPHPLYRGHGLRGDDGTQFPFINWKNYGWEVQPYQPQHMRYFNLDDGDKGIQFPFIPPVVGTLVHDRRFIVNMGTMMGIR